MKRKILLRAVCALASVLAIGAGVRQLSADRYRDPIERALTTALGRRVTIGAVHLDLLAGPGFRLSDVTIADESSGGEPLAYVGELRAAPRLWSLFSGHLQFASLTLDDAHLNLARTTGERWNFEPLLRPGLYASFPHLRMRAGRINFKFEGRKSSFYLLDSDLDISVANRAGTRWRINFRGAPARTDRPAHGFGLIEASGDWTTPRGIAGHLDLNTRLERSEISDIVSLIRGYDAGVHGYVSGGLHIAGVLDSLGAEGLLRVSDLHGWDEATQSPSAFEFRVSGTADLAGRRVELFAEPRGAGLVHVHLTSAFGDAAQAIEFHVVSDGVPVDSLPALLRNFGAPVPAGLALKGTVAGDLDFASGRGWTGSALVQGLTVAVPGAPPLSFMPAAVELRDTGVALAPVAIASGGDAVGSMGARYSLADGSFGLDLISAAAPVGSVLRNFPGASIPLFSVLRQGIWTGELHLDRGLSGASKWSGSGTLTDAAAELPEIAGPLEIVSSRMDISGDAITLSKSRFRAGGITATGEYSYVAGAARPHRFRFSADTVEAAQLEQVFEPALRRRASLIDLALQLGRAPSPDWLRHLHAQGTVQLAGIDIAGTLLKRFRAQVVWDGPVVAMNALQGVVAGAAMKGQLALDLHSNEPRYTAAGNLLGLEWGGGTVDASFSAQSAGFGVELLANLKAGGTFRAEDLEMDPLGPIRSATGRVEWDGAPQGIQITQLELVSDGETWTGTGASDGAPGDVLLKLASAKGNLNLAGSLVDARRVWVER